MPLFKCNDCHHEWESYRSPEGDMRATCDWCGANGHIIQELTPLEVMCQRGFSAPYKKLDDWLYEVEAFSLRSERIPEDAMEWVKTAWQLAYLAGFEAGRRSKNDG